MRKYRIATATLLALLLLSNAWWAYRLVDAAISQTYLRASFDTASEQLTQSLALLQVVAKPGATRTAIIAAARLPTDTIAPFEKDGYVWVGQLGLQFNEQGQFVKAVAGIPEGEK